ncbi:MAG: damage-inducible protein DinB [Gammaproteobacteria bacterium]|nr:damage-inducible protein DinB [Gammaproteobacteria bacterium]
MFTGTYPQLMAEYNRWMNQRLYAVCAGLSDEERKRDRGAFFKSVHGTLDHILWGDRAWLARFNGKTYDTGPVGQLLCEDFPKLRAARAEMDDEIHAWARDVTPEWLAAPMTWTSKLYGFTQTQPRWVLVTQMFNHQTHHRGQVTTLLKQMGIDPGVTDIPLLPLLGARR